MATKTLDQLNCRNFKIILFQEIITHEGDFCM